MPTVLEQAKRLTIDPGVHYLADLIDQLAARVDECCGSSSLTVAPAKGAADSAAFTTGAESPVPAATGAKATHTKGGAASSAPARKKQGHQ